MESTCKASDSVDVLCEKTKDLSLPITKVLRNSRAISNLAQSTFVCMVLAGKVSVTLEIFWRNSSPTPPCPHTGDKITSTLAATNATIGAIVGDAARLIAVRAYIVRAWKTCTSSHALLIVPHQCRC